MELLLKQLEVPVRSIFIIAGPNGAGKTTFAREYLLGEALCPNFLNADLIAAGLSPFAPEHAAIKAGRLMLQMTEEYVKKEESFALETTLSGFGYARAISQWQAAGYHITLIFLQLPNAEAALARVKERVQQGGHGVPEDVVRRRFTAGLHNFETIYKPLPDVWLHYDNSGETPVLIDWSKLL